MGWQVIIGESGENCFGIDRQIFSHSGLANASSQISLARASTVLHPRNGTLLSVY
jgi:hypothetical protein